jgi:hypothetical protein
MKRATGPPEKDAAPTKAPLKTDRQQLFSEEGRCQSGVLRETPLMNWWQQKRRRCVSCNAIVTNRNLGGYNGRGAFTGSLYCINCADNVTVLGGRGQ